MQTSNRRLVDVTNKLLLLAQAEHGDAHTRLRAGRPELPPRCAAWSSWPRWPTGAASTWGWRPRSRCSCWRSPRCSMRSVSNLLDNALRYTQEGGRVTVGVRETEGRVALTVEDNGPGIAPEVRERVFERFYRVAQDSEGTGLGLAIVREIARAFDADVDLSANPREASGLLVTVRFPPVAPARAGGERVGLT
jgi:two-component system sensor histidine kinase TctE